MVGVGAGINHRDGNGVRTLGHIPRQGRLNPGEVPLRWIIRIVRYCGRQGNAIFFDAGEQTGALERLLHAVYKGFRDANHFGVDLRNFVVNRGPVESEGGGYVVRGVTGLYDQAPGDVVRLLRQDYGS